MTNERFNELLNGPLSHPLPMFTITRLSLALMAVVEATGAEGEKALEAYCEQRAVQDEPDDLRDEEYDPVEDGPRCDVCGVNLEFNPCICGPAGPKLGGVWTGENGKRERAGRQEESDGL